MDKLNLPFGDNAGHLTVQEDHSFGRKAVAFDLPEDGRVIGREHIGGLIEWLQGFLEETKPALPTLPHAVIRATVTTGQGQTQNVALSRVDDDNSPWKTTEEVGDGVLWFGEDSIVSFEVLFPGVGKEES